MYRVSSGTSWEDKYGYVRAVRYGPHVAISGTTATVNGTVIGVNDPYVQTMVAFGIAMDALRRCGLDSEHVVRTRMYLVDITDADEVGRAHRELFGSTPPAASMVEVNRLLQPEHLVEVEIDAYADA